MDRTESPQFELLSKGTGFSSGQEENLQSPGYRLYSDAQSWSDYWSGSFAEPVPKVDFNQDVVLCVFQGTKSTGGYAIEVAQIDFDDDGTMQVELDLKEPGPQDMVIQVFTQPYAFYTLRIPKSDRERLDGLDVSFFHTEEQTRAPVQMKRL